MWEDGHGTIWIIAECKGSKVKCKKSIDICGTLGFSLRCSHLDKVYRRMALRICSAFRTVSTEAALVQIGILARSSSNASYWSNGNRSGSEILGKPIGVHTNNLAIWCGKKHGQVDFMTLLLHDSNSDRAWLVQRLPVAFSAWPIKHLQYVPSN